MNLSVYFDVYNAIKDVQEEFTVSKVLRNNKRLIFLLTLISSNFAIIYRDKFFRIMVAQAIILLTDVVIINGVAYKLNGDAYKEEAEKRLSALASILDRMNISTTNELIKESNCYHRAYNIKFNKKLIPQIIESKYILVPTNNNMGDVSILQEHVVGSQEYVLSLGSSKKALQPVFSHH